MNVGGVVKSHQKISALDGGFEGTLSQNDCFGSSTAALGAIDEDDVAELAVGARGDGSGGLAGGGSLAGDPRASGPAGIEHPAPGKEQ